MKHFLKAYQPRRICVTTCFFAWLFLHALPALAVPVQQQPPGGLPRQRQSINDGWRFMRYSGEPDSLIYDERPTVTNRNDNMVADTRAADSGKAKASDRALKKWILPTANNFIKDTAKHYPQPAGNPGAGFPFVQNDFNDNSWALVDLPHDWAIKGPFYEGEHTIVGGGMGRLPVQGVAWYRRKLDIPVTDSGKSIYLEIDGAMSYAMVWINGHLAGGWPYGYNSFRIDLTPYLHPGPGNQLAIRIDNPANSSRWYPGGGIYRNVWLTTVNKLHVAQWGTAVQTHHVTANAATIHLAVEVENKNNLAEAFTATTEVFALNEKLQKAGAKLVSLPGVKASVAGKSKTGFQHEVVMNKPILWRPMPATQQRLYVAVTRLYAKGKLVDEYETRFGIRSIVSDPVKGIVVNGTPVRLQGVNQHHDLGALGAAFNIRAAERQLEMLREMGCNAIRFAHNPPAPELLDVTDKMGFLVVDEVFDCWEKGKTPLDFHLIFADWHEADIRSFIRRDKNHPSIIQWSFGNEVGEQYTGEAGAELAKKLYDIVRDEDSTRPATASMNYAKPGMPFPAFMDVLSLNYQGEGIRDAPAYAHLRGIRTTPLYAQFQQQYPCQLIQSSETSSALSTRGTYIFPVTGGTSAPVSDSTGGDPRNKFVSAYDLYTAAFGASPDKVFYAQDHHPFVAGEFVWSGFDYLGEPTPYYSARSSYSGIIDLAGFKKDRFYLYQSRWRLNLPMAHILPHWNWPARKGMVTPVHVYTSGEEAELFLNNRSLGRKKKAAFEYRLRWDSVLYQPGELKVICYKKGKPWAADMVQTTGEPAALQLVADRKIIAADGSDISFVTVRITDSKGRLVPDANNVVTFSVSGPATIAATDNGNPADLVAFTSPQRQALGGLALVIIQSKKNVRGVAAIHVTAAGLAPARLTIQYK